MPPRWHNFDRLRVLATVGVISLHCGLLITTVLATERPDIVSAFNVGNAADSVGRFAVNCFFMISGALLLAPERSFRLWPQFRRVAIPLAVWVVIYLVANLALDARGQRQVGDGLKDVELSAPGNLIRSLVGLPPVYHLWFVYVLLAIYLLVPLLRAITDRPEPQRRQLLLWLLTLWAATLVLAWGKHYWDGFPVPYYESIRLLPPTYLGIFVLGYVIHHYKPAVPRWLFAAGAVAGLAWTFVGTWLAARSGAEDWMWSLDNVNPPVLLFSVGVFGWFATRDSSPGRLGGLTARLSALSFRVYLLHVLVLHLLFHLTPLRSMVRSDPVTLMVVLLVGTVLISTLLAWAIDLVRPIRRYV